LCIQPGGCAFAAASLCADCEIHDARSDNALLHGTFLRLGFSLRKSLPEIEVDMDLFTVIALILSILLLAHLIFSLLFPEKL
jgi:K+-transporting ATPase KdpF subunit